MIDEKIIYKHIKTSLKISLKQLKDYKNKNIKIFTFYQHNPINKIDEKYEYNIVDIPLSNDFTILINSDFSINELQKLFVLCHIDYLDDNNNLSQKIEKIINNQIKLEVSNSIIDD